MDLISTAGKLYFSNSALSGSNKLQVPEKIWWPFLSVFVEQAQRWLYDLVQHVNTLPSTRVQARPSMDSRLPQLVALRGSINSAQTLFFHPLSTDWGACLPFHTQSWRLMLIYGYLLPSPPQDTLTSPKWCFLNICSSFIWWDRRKHTFIRKLK